MRKPFREQNSPGGRFRMDFKGEPFFPEHEFLFEPVDKSLADITERSNIVGKYSHCNSHRLASV
jgi:hypothetical protein